MYEIKRLLRWILFGLPNPGVRKYELFYFAIQIGLVFKENMCFKETLAKYFKSINIGILMANDNHSRECASYGNRDIEMPSTYLISLGRPQGVRIEPISIA